MVVMLTISVENKAHLDYIPCIIFPPVHVSPPSAPFTNSLFLQQGVALEERPPPHGPAFLFNTE